MERKKPREVSERNKDYRERKRKKDLEENFERISSQYDFFRIPKASRGVPSRTGGLREREHGRKASESSEEENFPNSNFPGGEWESTESDSEEQVGVLGSEELEAQEEVDNLPSNNILQLSPPHYKGREWSREQLERELLEEKRKTQQDFPLLDFRKERDFLFNIENHPNLTPFTTGEAVPYIVPELVKLYDARQTDFFSSLKKKGEEERAGLLVTLMKRDILYSHAQTTNKNKELFDDSENIPKEYSDFLQLPVFSIPQCYCVVEYWNEHKAKLYYPNLPGDSHCGNCEKKLSTLNNFHIYSLPEQFSRIFSKKENREALFQDLEKMKEKTSLFRQELHRNPQGADESLFNEGTVLDGYRSSLFSQSHVKFGVYGGEKNHFVIELALFVDGFNVNNDREVESVTGFILNLPDKLRYLQDNVVQFASFNKKQNKKPSTSAFIPLIDYLNFLANEGTYFEYLDDDGEVETVFFKPLVSFFIIDKESATSLMGIAKHVAKESCFSCMIRGNYECNHTYFQRKIHVWENSRFDDRHSARRTSKLSHIAFELNHFPPNKRVCGVKEFDWWSMLAGREHCSRVMNDPFHTHCVSGVAKRLVSILPFKSTNKPLIEKLDNSFFRHIKLPSHISSHSNDWNSSGANGSSWNNMITWTSTPILYANKIGSDFLELWSQYAINYTNLSSKTQHLQVRKVMEIQKSNLEWVQKMHRFFGNSPRFFFPKMHVASEHTAPDSLKVGKVHIASSASGESELGAKKLHGIFSNRNQMCSIHNYISVCHRMDMCSFIVDSMLKRGPQEVFFNKKIGEKFVFVHKWMNKEEAGPIVPRAESLQEVELPTGKFSSKRMLEVENRETNRKVVVKILDYNEGQETMDCFIQLQNGRLGVLRAIHPVSKKCIFNPGRLVKRHCGNLWECKFDFSQFKTVSHSQVKGPVFCFPKNPDSDVPDYEEVLVVLYN